MQQGDLIKFGKYVWRAAAVENDRALIITNDIVELRAYHDRPGEVTWAESEIRSYLNGDFYNSFAPRERASVIPADLVTGDNPWFGTPGGEPTIDKVFLLSISEAVSLCFGDSSALLVPPNGKYKYWFTRKDLNNVRRRAAYLGYSWWWWLRSPGRKAAKAAYVHGDGNIGIQGNNAQKCNISGVYHPVGNDVRGGVRPAMWIALKDNATADR